MFKKSRLYDLSLAIGNSLDLRINCRSFLDELNIQVAVEAASVWLKNDLVASDLPPTREAAGDFLVLLCGCPEDRFQTDRVPMNHPVFGRLAEASFATGWGDDVFRDLKLERSHHDGANAVFALSDFGLLYLHSPDRRGPFPEADLKELGRVVSKFTVSVEACLAHNRLAREIGRRRRAEINLQQREKHFRALIENALDIMLVLDYDATIDFASPSVFGALGYLPAELKGRNFFELVDPEEVSEHIEIFRSRVRTGGEAPTNEMRVRHADGTWRFLAVSSNYRLSDPSVAGVIMNCHDVTERHKWTAQLEAARGRAIEASRAKSEFVANVSHEIRNPINAVIGMATLLLDGDLDPRQRNCINTIRVSGETLLNLIEDILDLSRIESGRLEIVPEVFRLSESIQVCLDMVALKAEEKRLQLGSIIDPLIPDQLYGAEPRIRQVLLNLLSNAVKFTHQGEVTVSVEGKQLDEETIGLEIAVRDTGIGIAEATAKKLFRPFVQGDASTTKRYGGSGLGLAISKRLCGLMGGQIWIEPHSGPGTTFKFTVPVKIAPPPYGVPETESALPEVPPMRVLVVEDDEIGRQVAIMMLQSLGQDVDAVANGVEALKAVKRCSYDVVFTDIQMPGIDGMELTQLIRKLKLDKQPRVVAMTARATPEDLQLCLEAGMDGHLTKPVLKEGFIQELVGSGHRGSNSGEVREILDVDEERIAALRRTGDGAMLIDLIGIYLKETPVRLEEVQHAIEAGDLESAARIAHKIKGSSSNLGLPAVAATSARLEEHGRRGDLEGAESDRDHIVDAYQRASELLQNMLDGEIERMAGESR